MHKWCASIIIYSGFATTERSCSEGARDESFSYSLLDSVFLVDDLLWEPSEAVGTALEGSDDSICSVWVVDDVELYLRANQTQHPMSLHTLSILLRAIHS